MIRNGVAWARVMSLPSTTPTKSRETGIAADDKWHATDAAQWNK
jgi:hypothetical protein